jgi:hypothetical protein
MSLFNRNQLVAATITVAVASAYLMISSPGLALV